MNENATPDRDLCAGQLDAHKTLLASRVEIHQRYSVPPIDFVQWVLDLVPWKGDERVVDVGCGSGNYVAPLAERLAAASGHRPQPEKHVLGDVSLRMLRDLRRPSGPPVINLDVIALPFPDGFWDVILANHVLQDVPDVDHAVAECCRVLRMRGRLVAATDSQTTMAELTTLIREGYDRLGVSLSALPHSPLGGFTLETGYAVLARWLDQVERHVLHSALVFPEPEPLLIYIDSLQSLYEPGLPPGISWDNLLGVWHKLVSDHIGRHGEFRINKVSGAFVAFKRRHP